MFEHSRQPVPARWLVAEAAALPPGPAVMGMLALVDRAGLDAGSRVDWLVAWERCSRWVAAQHASAVVAVAGPVAADRDD